MKISVSGGKKHHQVIAQRVLDWCGDFFCLNGNVEVHLSLIKSRKDIDCWGECTEGEGKSYDIKVVHEQTLRDFVATITHEMVHVKQWESGVWTSLISLRRLRFL